MIATPATKNFMCAVRAAAVPSASRPSRLWACCHASNSCTSNPTVFPHPWQNSNLSDREHRHHSCFGVLEDVAVHHPVARVERNEADVDALATVHEHRVA